MNPIRRIALLATVSLAWSVTSALVASASSTPFSVHWTAPGDDNVTGRATVYDLRYSITPLTAANFALATRLTGLLAPAVAGTAETFVVSGLPDSVSYFIAIKAADEAGNWSALSNIATRIAPTADVEGAVLALSFSAPWPNPARQSVRWAFSVPQAAEVRVDIFDITGRHVRNVANGRHEASRGELSWDLRDERGRRVEPGLYLVKARLGSSERTGRVVVVR